jgi:uncharacterized protein (DUF1330 family)
MKWTVPAIAAAFVFGAIIGGSYAPTQTLKAAEGSVPYYEVAEINVKDQAGYEASGVKDVRASQDALGGVLVAGGYNKATGFLGDPPANRYLIIRYPSKEAAEKHWNDSVSKWWNSEGHKYATFRAVGAEGVMPK